MRLSIIIPARQEMFLAKTVENILENIEDDTEVIAVLDGAWTDPPIPHHERVNVIYLPESVGQRAATSIGAKLARGKYIAKTDAHCSFDKGFDRKMIEFMEKHGNITAVSIMHNLWAFDWKCMKCGSRWYQGTTPTQCMIQERAPVPNPACDSKDFKRIITWKVEAKRHESAAKNWKRRHSPTNTSYCFDSEPHFQYFNDYARRPETTKMRDEERYTETMSLQGSFWMMSREKYLAYIPFRERFGSWGNEGIEIACREWLTGGKVLVNHDTWYGHLFRTQGGDFNFPYKQAQNKVRETKKAVWDAIRNMEIPGQILPVDWLIERFAPVPGWTEEKIKELKIN